MFSSLFRALGGRAMRQRDLRMLLIAVFLTELGVSAAFPLRLLYAQAHHATPAELGMMAGAFFLAPVLCQMPLGWLVDRWGRVPVLLFGMIGHAIIGVAYIIFNSPVDLISLRFLEGVVIAGVQPATAAYIADVTSEDHRAEAYGVLSAAGSGGLLIGPLFGGIVGQQFGFVGADMLSVVFGLGGPGAGLDPGAGPPSRHPRLRAIRAVAAIPYPSLTGRLRYHFRLLQRHGRILGPLDDLDPRFGRFIHLYRLHVHRVRRPWYLARGHWRQDE